MLSRGRIVTGRLGEDAAIDLLKRKGYRIIERNYKTPFGEIDAIAKDGKMIVFVEVKSRLSSSMGPPYLSVTWRKKQKIVQNALFYLAGNGLLDCVWRIDVVSVKMSYGYKTESIEIIKNAVCEEDV